MSFADRKRIILAKLESSYGTDAGPASTDAVLCSDLTITPLDGKTVERNFIRSFYGASGTVRVEKFSKISFKTELAGAGTAGNTPQWNNLLKACNFSSTSVGTVTGTAQAGAATSITLAAGASSTDDAYTGQTITINGGTGSGQTNEIIDYVGSTKVATVSKTWGTNPSATSVYSLGPGIQYAPNSNFGRTTNTGLTIWFNNEGVKHVLLGARGTFSIELSVSGIPMINWDFTGLHGTISDNDISGVSTDYTGWKVPVPATTTNSTDLVLMDWQSGILESLTIDIGNQVTYRSLVGMEDVLISDRKASLKCKIEATTVASKDFFTATKSGNYANFYIKHGQTAGNVIALSSNRLQLQGINYSATDGTTMLDLDGLFVPNDTVGNDEIRIVVK